MAEEPGEEAVEPEVVEINETEEVAEISEPNDDETEEMAEMAEPDDNETEAVAEMTERLIRKKVHLLKNPCRQNRA